jgi:hypothetical protein
MNDKKELCDTCENCFIKTYANKDNGDKEVIKECLINRLHVYNDFIKHSEQPVECNKYKELNKN